jgi:hypothetical protein
MALQDQPELQQTDLGSWAATATSALERNAKTIVICVVVLIAVLVVAIIVSNTSHEKNTASWDAFAAAQSAEDYANVASDFPGTQVALWARLNEAESLFREAVRLQFMDRAAAIGQMKKAGEAFDSVLENADLPIEARERALLGHARLLEAQAGSREEVAAAIAAYKDFQKAFPESPVYGSSVKARIESLESEDSLKFYAWFAKQTPKPEDFKKPQDGMPGGFPGGFPGGMPGGLPSGHPEIPITLPDIPEELFPAEPILPPPAAPDAPAKETPAETDAPAETGTPPAADSPDTPAKPDDAPPEP